MLAQFRAAKGEQSQNAGSKRTTKTERAEELLGVTKVSIPSD
jgi:hypothetical protein